jgi:hypothetical protein
MNPIQKNIEEVLGIEGLSQEEQEDIVTRIGALIYQNVLMRALDKMSEEDQDEFEKILDKDATSEEIFSFLEEKVDNFKDIINEESLKFRK